MKILKKFNQSMSRLVCGDKFQICGQSFTLTAATLNHHQYALLVRDDASGHAISGMMRAAYDDTVSRFVVDPQEFIDVMRGASFDFIYKGVNLAPFFKAGKADFSAAETVDITVGIGDHLTVNFLGKDHEVMIVSAGYGKALLVCPDGKRFGEIFTVADTLDITNGELLGQHPSATFFHKEGEVVMC